MITGLRFLTGLAAIVTVTVSKGLRQLLRPRPNTKAKVACRGRPSTLIGGGRPPGAARREREKQERIDVAKSGFLTSCRRAKLEDYKEWLRRPGAVAKHRYNHDLDTHCTHNDRCYGYPEWLVAKRDIKVTPLYGAMSVHIIVPEGVELTGDLGHSKAYLADGRVLGGEANRYRNT